MWVDSQVENLFELYQYIINTNDSLLEDLYLRYTFESPETVKAIVADHSRMPENRTAQLRLAKTLIEMITGDKHTAEQISNYRRYFQINFDEIVN